MAEVKTNEHMSLIELANRLHNGVLQEIAETLALTMETFQDMIWAPSNSPTAHYHTRRIAQPTGAFRGINEGVDAEISQTCEVVEPIALLEGRSEIDDYWLGLSGNPARARYDEDISFVEGLGETFLTNLWYGILATTPRGLNGFAERYKSHTNDANVETAGGTTALTSGHFIQWGPKMVHLVYPPGLRTVGSAGDLWPNIIEIKDLGMQLVTGANSKSMTAMVTRFRVNAGLVIHDDRCYQRLANIESDGDPAFDPDLAIKLINNMKARGKGTRLYLNKTGLTQLDQLAKEDTNVQYKPAEAFGIPTTYFRGIPVRLDEGITDAETVTT